MGLFVQEVTEEWGCELEQQRALSDSENWPCSTEIETPFDLELDWTLGLD